MHWKYLVDVPFPTEISLAHHAKSESGCREYSPFRMVPPVHTLHGVYKQENSIMFSFYMGLIYQIGKIIKNISDKNAIILINITNKETVWGELAYADCGSNETEKDTRIANVLTRDGTANRLSER
ncbi:hypothetical protein St703_11030 [Sporolactobacillus terrae]|uniref:Uncharacterized protein n=1 Tax=Sporolactobacillus terrae TaxID=269673 RepID=A0A5K7X0I3_9BACL|nr:hypothetical protein St703_11030 [Sporolactobacillus terrae]